MNILERLKYIKNIKDLEHLEQIATKVALFCLDETSGASGTRPCQNRSPWIRSYPAAQGSPASPVARVPHHNKNQTRSRRIRNNMVKWEGIPVYNEGYLQTDPREGN